MEARQWYIDQYFTNIAINKEYPNLFYVRKSILKAVESSMPKFSGTLLDVGCGIKPYKEFILDRNKRVTSYIGLDFEEAIVGEYALGKPDLFWQGDVIPMDDHSVDTVIATELFEHCPDPERVMKEMARVLKPGGVLFFTVPFLWNLHLVPHDEYRYTPFSLKRHLQNAGFTNIEMKALGRWDASLAQMLALWYQHRPMRRLLKKILWLFLVPVIRVLVKAEEKLVEDGRFGEGDMVTGLSGTAYK